MRPLPQPDQIPALYSFRFQIKITQNHGVILKVEFLLGWRPKCLSIEQLEAMMIIQLLY